MNFSSSKIINASGCNSLARDTDMLNRNKDTKNVANHTYLTALAQERL